MTKFGAVDVGGWLFSGLVIVFIAGAAALMIYALWGQLTIHDTVTLEVTGKGDVVRDFDDEDECTLLNRSSVECDEHRHWIVNTRGESFEIGESLFAEVVVGKKHTFSVSGYKHLRVINDILE